MRLVPNTHVRQDREGLVGAAGFPSHHDAEAMRTLGARYDLVRPRIVPFAGAVSGVKARVLFCDETGQRTGSFKVRGALAKLEALAREGVKSVVAASAGNHGAGVAFAAARLGMRATVFVPKGAPKVKCDKIASASELVVLRRSSEGDYDGAEREAMRFSAETGDPFVSPYDDPLVVAGNGMSLGFELADELSACGVRESSLFVLAPAGGTGLAVGLALALPRAHVFGVQSEVSPAFALSLARGHAVVNLPLDGETLAEGLEGGIAEGAFRRAKDALSGALVVDEPALRRALAFSHRTLGVPIEGSAATVLVPCLAEPSELVQLGQLGEALQSAEKTVVAVLTGRNIDTEKARLL